MPVNVRFGLLMASITALSWSVLAIALKFALDHASAITIVGFRFLVASIGLFLFLILFDRNSLKVLKAPPWTLVVGAICLGINYLGYMKGVELTTASNAQIFIQTAPLGLLLVGVIYYREQFQKVQIFGLMIAVCGFGLFFQDQLTAAWEYKSTYLNGNLWIAISAVAWIIYAIFNKNNSSRVSTNSINILTYIICALIFLPMIDFSEIKMWSPWISILMVALGANTLLAYSCLSLALKHSPASMISAIITCNPIGTLLILALIDHFDIPQISPEPLSLTGYLGAAAVISGVAIAIINSKKKDA